MLTYANFICAGAGITPVYQILQKIVETGEEETEAVVLYGVCGCGCKSSASYYHISSVLILVHTYRPHPLYF